MNSEKMAEESTDDLIEYIKWGKQPEYKELAENAFIAFCLRFRDKIQTTCRIIAENKGYDHEVADKIAQEVFEKFYKYPNYKSSKCKSGDTDKCVELYLYKFAERGLYDYITNESSPFSGDEEIVTDYPDIEAMDAPQERKAELEKKYNIIKDALSRLSEKHKIIYLTYKQYESLLQGGKHNFRKPFLEKMQKSLGLSQVSIRVYKKEAIDKIEEYLKIYGSK